jgi:hypothetical protein
MAKDYFVLTKRDMKTEKRKSYGPKMLYDRCTEFKQKENAEKYALRNLPALIAKRILSPLTDEEKARVKDTKTPYVVVAEFYGKYHHYCYDGSSDALTTFDAIRCNESQLEKIVEEFAREGAENIIAGVELKTF